MLLKYTPEGANSRQWTYEPDKILSSEAEAIEKVTGMTYGEFGAALLKGSASARRALLWVYLKREDPTLRHAQVDPMTGTVATHYEAHELRQWREQVAASTALDNEDRAAALAALDDLIAAEVDEVDEAPKAPASDSASSTSDSSPASSTSPLLRSAG